VVTVSIQNLYGVGGLQKARIQKIVSEQSAKISSVCGARVVVKPSGPGDIYVMWSNASRSMVPCYSNPVYSYLDINAINSTNGLKVLPDGTSVPLKECLFRWLITHEALGHGMGIIQHGPSGIMHGYDPNNNTFSDIDDWMKRQLVQRYGAKPVAGSAEEGVPDCIIIPRQCEQCR